MPLFVITIRPLHRSDNSKIEKLIITSSYICTYTPPLLQSFYNKLIITYTILIEAVIVYPIVTPIRFIY